MQISPKQRPVLFLGISSLVGIGIACMYLVFESLVNQGTDIIWNTLAQSDVYHWRVIPLAIVLGIAYSFVLKKLKRDRLVAVNTDLASELSEQDPDTKLSDVMVILGVGVVSLLAGASLGPEASLVAASIAFVAWTSKKMKLSGSPQAKLLTITSLGALLCAFLYTLVPMIIPLLLLAKQKQLKLASALVVVLTCVSSWGIVMIVKQPSGARFPLSESYSLQSIIAAAVLGFLAILVAVVVKKLLVVSFTQAQKISKKKSWIVSAAVFGGILGLLYLIGGQSVQFSGEEGMKLLLENQYLLPAGLFLFVLIVKILATSWSLGTGYRGGMVFPSIYMATALGLAIDTAFSLSGSVHTGAIIGGTSGILLAMTNPIVGVVLVFSLFPLQLFLVMAAGVLGALAGQKLFRLLHIK